VVAFSARHEFDATPPTVAATMTDPDFVVGVELPDLEPAEVLEHRADGDGRMIRYRYRFVGHLDPIARRVLGKDRISWVQEVRVDAGDAHGVLAVVPDVRADRLHFAGEYRLEALEGTTVRSLQGELSIKVPLIAGRAEQHILPGLLRRIDLEADALRRWLAAGR
jgi:uncharacterized protein DUF2505